jgi:uncharacterized protein
MEQPSMTTFQQLALLLTVSLLVLVVVRFRHSTLVLSGGLVVIGGFTLVSLASGTVTLQELGLGLDRAWLPTLVLVLAWLALMLAYTPIADRIASRWFAKPPTLEAFRALQESRAKLMAGIIIAWILGGFLEELIARGIVLQAVEQGLTPWLTAPIAMGVAVGGAAVGAGLLHLYQGPRAVLIITQLSVLFGTLFVISGNNLWAVMLCHGLYDTIAFIRFANRQSRFSDLDGVASQP